MKKLITDNDFDISEITSNHYHCKDAQGIELDVIASNPIDAWKQAVSEGLFNHNHLLQFPIEITNNNWYHKLDKPPLKTADELESYRKWLSEVLDVIAKNNKRLKKVIVKGF